MGRAADAITGAERLNRLKEKSLIHENQENEQSLTYIMLETLREYALEKLNERNELTDLKHRHADYYIQLVETAEPNLTGTSQMEWFNRLNTERHNVQSALEWLVGLQNYADAARMAGILWRYWGAHSQLSIGMTWTEQIVKHAEVVPVHTRAKLMYGMGRLNYLQHHDVKSAKYLKLGLALYEEIEDAPGQAAIRVSLGEVELRMGNHLVAEGHFQHSLALYVTLDDQAGFARCLAQLGRLAIGEGNLVGAASLFQQSLDLIRQFGSMESIAIGLNDLAEVLRAQGKYTEAAELYRESLEIYHKLDFDSGVAVILHNLGQLNSQLGDYAGALLCFQDALRLLQDLEEKQIITECLAGIGGAFLHIGEAARAVRFLSAANTLMDVMQIQLELADQSNYEKNLEEARQQIQEPQWSTLWTEGQNMRLENIFADAFRSTPTPAE